MGFVSRSGILSAAASAGLLALFAAAGMAALPLRTATATWSFSPAVPMDRTLEPTVAGSGIPVLTLRPDRTTIRSGYARQEDDGRIRVTLYDPSDPLLARASEAVLFFADIRTLWMLATEAERSELRQGFDRLGAAMRQSADAILRSPEFTREYRPALQESARDAFDKAWRAPATRAAYDEMMRAAEPIVRDTAMREIRPLVMRRLDGLIWEILQANVGAVLDVFNARPWNTAPLEQALEAAMRDVREFGVLERMAGAIVETRQTKLFLQTFANGMMDALAADPRVEATVMRLVTDPRMGVHLAPVGQPVGELSRMAPRILFGVRADADLNALAAYAFHGFINGRTGPVVILMSPQQRDEMLRLDPRAPKLLVRSAGP
ncbi:hypothetical protein [Azospirillum thermophilum]|uniref:Uncharacterized protein n=1 Tax=Azospirillum thermophilum TaxID=2202148 RepID=A0A2S2CMW6_9PROT|nr:hypothetical protein [Azospirillum thermophilum]AWK85720.1 hypothetical protein DEW08_05670 [Azospirillum thermophilum]